MPGVRHLRTSQAPATSRPRRATRVDRELHRGGKREQVHAVRDGLAHEDPEQRRPHRAATTGRRARNGDDRSRLPMAAAGGRRSVCRRMGVVDTSAWKGMRSEGARATPYRAGADAEDALPVRSIGLRFLTSGFFARRLAFLSRARDPVRRDIVSPLGSGPKDAPSGPPLLGREDVTAATCDFRPWCSSPADEP